MKIENRKFLAKEKIEIKSIQVDDIRGCIMKVHRYQIEVMWLIFALLGIWMYAGKLSVLIHRLIRQKSLQKKPLFVNQIRPPPLFG